MKWSPKKALCQEARYPEDGAVLETLRTLGGSTELKGGH